jgi:hypothetical protein
MIIYINGMRVSCPPDPEDPSDDFAALCRWVDRQPTGYWERGHHITDEAGRVIRINVTISVVLGGHAEASGAGGGDA